MWEIIFGVIGFFVGLFLWSTIYGRIMEMYLRKSMHLPSNLAVCLVSILITAGILALGSIFITGFIYGAVVSGIVMLFNIGKLKNEVIETIQNKHR
jgi:hypothetical protein